MKTKFLESSLPYAAQARVLECDIQKTWRNESLYSSEEIPQGEKSYQVGMFPYPSGNAHLGHALVYSITDTISRLERMRGKHVLNPLGWDAFGLPAENAAIKNNIHPGPWTEKNIKQMRDDQIGPMGFSFDLAREINTSSPEYYKWSQWLFLKLYEQGLVYRANEYVNWDPVDQTVLANEQIIDGKGWRSGAPIERRKMEQWYVRITDYAEDLWNGLDTLDGWSEASKGAQRNWIGRKEGAQINMLVEGTKNTLNVFTTRPELLYGATAIVVAPESESITAITSPERSTEVEAFRQSAMRKSEVERVSSEQKSGIFTGASVRHPLTGELLPVYVADYVISTHGGIFLCTPAHDENDKRFADAVGLPSRSVLANEAEGTAPSLINSQRFDGMAPGVAARAITAQLTEQGVGGMAIRYRLRDWAIGRQRMWGAPIPMMHDAAGQWVPVAYEDLPVRLPDTADFKASQGRSPLTTNPSFFNFVAKDGTIYTRETDTMDTFMCSSWYFWRFLDPKEDTQPWDPKKAAAWMPIDNYVGGLEHANQHLIYARFMSHFLYGMGMTPTKEPIRNFLDNGMIQMGGEKMSKSLGNLVRPDEMIQKYGADALHMYVLSTGPYQRNSEWDESGLGHKQAFLGRIFNFFRNTDVPTGQIELTAQDVTDPWSKKLLVRIHETGEAVEREVLKNHNFHVAVAQTHEMANTLFGARTEASTPQHKKVLGYVMQNYLKVLGLTAPHLADTLWREKTELNTSLFVQPWVSVAPELRQMDTSLVRVPVMIEGKKRGEFDVQNVRDDEAVITQLKAGPESERLNEIFNGIVYDKVVIVRDKSCAVRMVNFARTVNKP